MTGRILMVAFGIALLLLVPYDTAHAQPSSRVISVSPASTQLTVDPGGSVSMALEILNPGEDTYAVELSTTPYYVTGLNYDAHFTQLPGTLNASDWISLSATTMQLESNKTLTVDYEVTVPAGTPAGGYYAVIFAETSQESISGRGIISRKRVGSLIYITVNGEVQKSGFLTGKAVAPFSFSKEVPLIVRVANDGGVHFISTINFSVADLNGNEIYSEEQERMILPTTEREISSNWTSTEPIGVYTVRRQATVAGDLVNLDEQRIIIVSPWLVAFLVTFLISFISLLLLGSKRRRQKSNRVR